MEGERVPETPIHHQFHLFDYNTHKPRLKVPISAERIRQAKELMKQGKPADAAAAMRQVREALEDFERRLTNKPEEK